ncbi:metal ABC transporter permease [Porphyromonadaceae bacterium]
MNMIIDRLHTFSKIAPSGSLILSVVCGLVGTYIVVRRLVFISGGITHASFGGLGLGFYLGINPLLSASVFAIFSAFGVEWLSKYRKVREDSAIAVMWALGMAVGIILVFMTPGYSTGMSEFLFGNVLTITQTDLIWFSGLAIILFAGFIFFGRLIAFVAFDTEFARSQGVAVRRLEYLMMFFIALTIVFSIRMVGIILLMSMLTIPQLIAGLFTFRFQTMAWLAIGIGLIGSVTGLLLSAIYNIPAGATIITLLIILYAVISFTQYCYKRLRHEYH